MSRKITVVCPVCRKGRELVADRKQKRGLGMCQPCHIESMRGRSFTAHLTETSVTANKTPRLPAEPTTAIPGTSEKLMVMAARVERGEQPNHPDDLRAVSNTQPQGRASWRPTASGDSPELARLKLAGKTAAEHKRRKRRHCRPKPCQPSL